MKNERGITLIALVITIIVLLVLAGVSLSLMLGNNGVLKKAKNAKEINDEVTALEKTKIEVAASYKEDRTIDLDKLNENLKKIENLKYNGKAINTDKSNNDEYNIIVKLPAVISIDENKFEILANGDVIKSLYVTEGLVLRYDGIENTRAGNNPNATVWEDLSGNENDGIFSNAMVSNQNDITSLSKGYYSPEEKGYVFLHNDAYIRSKNNIGISGDANFTVEVVVEQWSNNKSSGYSIGTNHRAPLWFGNSNAIMGGSAQPVISGERWIGIDGMNSGLYSEAKDHNFINNVTSLSFRKIKKGVINAKETDAAEAFYNGNFTTLAVSSGTLQFNILNSQAEVGRAWQWGGQNRTFYGSIQSIRIYDRVLTDEEVQINFKTDKERFNIE